jgi:hypothetical protein
MNDEDFIALARIVQEEFEQIGASDLAADENFIVRDDEESAPRLLDPRSRVIALLEMLDRHLAIQDRQTYRTAISQINAVLSHGRVERVIVRFIARGTTADPSPMERDLALVPQLAQLRRDLNVLIGQLREAPYEP